MRSSGVLRYSPEIRPGVSTRRDGGSTRWWLIIDCDPELGRLLRHYFSLAHHRTRVLQNPLWGAHISVIRDEEPPHLAAWERRDGTPIEFDYDPAWQETKGFVWCAVECPAALAIREELCLPREPTPALHLTFGNLHAEFAGDASAE